MVGCDCPEIVRISPFDRDGVDPNFIPAGLLLALETDAALEIRLAELDDFLSLMSRLATPPIELPLELCCDAPPLFLCSCIVFAFFFFFFPLLLTPFASGTSSSVPVALSSSVPSSLSGRAFISVFLVMGLAPRLPLPPPLPPSPLFEWRRCFEWKGEGVGEM